MAQAVVTEAFTFTVLFLNEQNEPVAVNNPVIDVFYFDPFGTKTMLITAQAMAATPNDLGRYTFTYTIPGGIADRTTLYGLMSGTDPGAGNLTLVVEQEVIAVASQAQGTQGLVTQFVKGG